MKQFAAFSLSALALSACGSPPGSSVREGSFTGSVAGYPLYVVESAFTTTGQSLEHPAYTVIMFSDRRGLCNGSQTEHFGMNLTYLHVDLFTRGWVAAPVPQGTHNLNTEDSITGSAQFSKRDDRCQFAPGTNPVSSTDGSVVVESIRAEPGGSVRGSFDITMRSGDRITGEFDAPYCAGSSLPSSFNCR